MKIDCYTHVVPPRFREKFYKYSDQFVTEKKIQSYRPALFDHEARFKVLDEFEDVVQVISINLPPLEEVAGPKEAVELARTANDEMAEWVAKYPQRYLAAIANLPLNDMDAALREAERAIMDLGFKGVQIFTSVQGKPLSSEAFLPLYEMMSRFDLPLWIHPVRRSTVPDYPTEKTSYHLVYDVFGWPYETSVAMARLVFAGIFEKFPKIKFISHHCGGMIPYYAGRIAVHYNNDLERAGLKHFEGLTKHPLEYFRMFYNDTAIQGNPSALMCSYSFFGEDRLLFGSDMPHDVENGGISIREAIKAIEDLNVPESCKKKIYEGNARRLFRL